MYQVEEESQIVSTKFEDNQSETSFARIEERSMKSKSSSTTFNRVHSGSIISKGTASKLGGILNKPRSSS